MLARLIQLSASAQRIVPPPTPSIPSAGSGPGPPPARARLASPGPGRRPQPSFGAEAADAARLSESSWRPGRASTGWAAASTGWAAAGSFSGGP
jgi:hypothetical protein